MAVFGAILYIPVVCVLIFHTTTPVADGAPHTKENAVLAQRASYPFGKPNRVMPR